MSATAPAKDEKRQQARDRGRVLIVRDEVDTGECRAALEGAGFEVVGVAGGAAALVALQKARPHVVLAHHALRGIGAEELARTLSNTEEETPVVFFGAEAADAARRVCALDAGAYDYFRLPEETRLLVMRARQLVRMKLTFERLRAEADRDYLTGLANRRRFRKALGQEVERWRRYRVPCALLLVDIDFLKRVNDAHGHPAGDTCIRAVAAALATFTRDNDTAARLGGEEFALLLAGADGAQALAAAERLREAVEAEPVGDIGRITVSVGVASCPQHARSERELFTASDAALYRAKSEGRNRSTLAPALSS
ncbi:MAG TPA: diguanylate cyclase [Pyrinomonadaceae bacterium]|nr:diguanylate cyclase [Pyrinomonadaceae bacterium]